MHLQVTDTSHSEAKSNQFFKRISLATKENKLRRGIEYEKNKETHRHMLIFKKT